MPLIRDNCRMCNKAYDYHSSHKYSVNRSHYVKSCRVCSDVCLKKMTPKERDIMFIEEYLKEYIKKTT